MARLCVTYPLRRGEGGNLLWKDDDIEAVVGTPAVAAGVFIPTGDRDLEFRLPIIQAQVVADHLRGKGYACAVAPEEP